MCASYGVCLAARVASTRRELEAMRAFSDLRRAVKLERRRVSKLAKLDERVARLRRRVSEYEAAGWDEFVRVVDVLVEEGALAVDWMFGEAVDSSGGGSSDLE